MRGNAVSLCTLSMLAVALAACSGDSKKVDNVDPNLFPSDYKREIFTTLTKKLDDPTGVRDSGITEPMLRQAGQEQRYIVCVRANSRNATRLYTGVKERVAYFYAGHLNQLIEATQGQCANVVYQPWPELEKYCLAAKSCT
ncbi:MAG TPA: hypothetical protein VGJ01_24220 [Pseudolabrys sp.]|jgi:hypothetical protein